MLPIAMFVARSVRGPEGPGAYVRQDRPPSLGLRKRRPVRTARAAAQPAPRPSCAPSRS